MILHLFPDTNKVFTIPYMKLIKKNDSEKVHIFVVWGNSVPEYPVENVYFINGLSKGVELLKLILRADKIILHSMFIPKYLLIINLIPNAIAKTYWVIWGGDLHFHEHSRECFWYKIYDIYRGFFIRKLKGICTLAKGDYELAQKWYRTKAEYFQAIYKVDELAYAQNLPIKQPNDTIRILIGNSATETNNHIHAFNVLKKLKNENIEIFCPLSYGDVRYADFVENCGREIFGAKFIPIRKLLSSKAYIDLLNSVDIGIFDNTRQQALGNIYLLLVMKKKLYLNSGSEMWESLHDVENIEIYDINEIESSSMKDVISMKEDSKEKNRTIVLAKNSDINIYEIWRIIFEA